MSQVDIISESLKALAKKKKKVIKTLCDQERYGWEKWLQVELAFALHAQGKPEFECPFTYDLRRQKPKSKEGREIGFLDIRFRANNYLKDYLTAIEIKVNSTEKGLRSVLADLIKVAAMRDDEWIYRCVTVVFVHGIHGDRSGKFKALKAALKDESNGISANVFPIAETKLEAVVIGWETGARKNMTRNAYSEWVEKVRGIYQKSGVLPKLASNHATR